MRIAYIADSQPATKTSKKNDLKQMALLLSSESRNSIASRRRSEKLLEIITGEDEKMT
jgi:hypothetical protein